MQFCCHRKRHERETETERERRARFCISVSASLCHSRNIFATTLLIISFSNISVYKTDGNRAESGGNSIRRKQNAERTMSRGRERAESKLNNIKIERTGQSLFLFLFLYFSTSLKSRSIPFRECTTKHTIDIWSL